MNGFIRRHQDILNLQAQDLNEACAQKMNRFIVDYYFQKLKEMLLKLDIVQNP